MKHTRAQARKSEPKANYHPGALTADNGGFKQDEAPPMSERVVVTTQRPILYDANERPIYRKVGFK
jgi:hypothetical protein